MSKYKFSIKITVAPYIILGLVTINDFFKKWMSINLEAMMSASVHYVSFILLLFCYIVSGILIASLYKACKNISSNKALRIILICNLIILLCFFAVGYLGITVFVNIKDFLTFDFILIGSYLYLLIQNLGGKNENL